MALAISVVTLLGVAATPGFASAGAKTTLESQSSGGVKGNGASGEPSISKTGRFIAFNSEANNLVGGDTNGEMDCFVRDAVGKTTERVSVATGGGQSNGQCFGPAISPDGRYVAFESNASNLGGPANGQIQVFIHDRVADTTTLVSRNGGVAGNGRSGDPAISNNGRFVVFESSASNLVAGDTNGNMDIFLWDRLDPGTIKRVSVRSNGTQGNRGSHDPSISAWGDYIVFDSLSSNLVGNDKNGVRDVFFHNRKAGKTSIVSINSSEKRGNGPSGNSAVSANGRWVAFSSRATNMTKADRANNLDVFLRDRKSGKTIQVSVSSSGRQGAGFSDDPTISFNGRYIAFESSAPNLVGKDPNKKWDAFLRDRVKRTTKILSRRSNGKPAYGGNSDDPAISGDGRFVAFESEALKVVLKDTDKVEDVFRRGPLR